ncbi:MAG: TolC family protein [Muribaculaceae bacterium]|nr:TolC family protein [Muribaculaceae bacterium]
MIKYKRKKGANWRNYLLISVITATSFVSLGQEPGEIDLESAAMKILTLSPEFISQTYSLESALKESKTAANLPDPELEGEYLWMPRDVDNRWAAQLKWNVEWPGVYDSRRKEASLKMSALEKEVWAQRNERLLEIRNLLLDYVQCQMKIDLLEELTRNNDTIYRLAEQAARGGEMTVLDLNKVRLEYANIKGARAAILDEEAEIRVSLSTIMGQDCGEVLKLMAHKFPEISLPSSEELEILKANAPAVAAARSEAEAARQAKAVAKMEALPSISLGYKHAFEDAMHFNGVTWGISVPIFSSRGKQKAASARIREAEYLVEARQRETDADVDALLRRLLLTRTQIDELAPIVENADYNSTLLKAYQGGVLTLIEYISDRNYFTNAAIELVNLRLTEAKTYALLLKYFNVADI